MNKKSMLSHLSALILIIGTTTTTIVAQKSFMVSNKKINTITLLPATGRTTHTIDQLITNIASRVTPKQATLSIGNESVKALSGVHVHNCNTVYLVSRGYMRSSKPGTNDNYIINGGGLKTASELIKDQIVPKGAPCICFDYPDNRAHYNFGQEIDLRCLTYVYKQILDQNPTATIVLIGDCRGAKCVLEFLTNKPSNIGAVILFSPFTNIWDLTKQLAQNYVNWLPKSDLIIYHFFNYYFPSYKPEQKALLDRLETIDPLLPFLITHRIFDTVISTSSVHNLIQALEKNGNPVKVVFSRDRIFRHSRMTGIKKVQEAVGTFLASTI